MIIVLSVLCFTTLIVHGNTCGVDKNDQEGAELGTAEGHARFVGWSCRRDTLAFRGTLLDFNHLNLTNAADLGKKFLRISVTNSKADNLHAAIFKGASWVRSLDLSLNRTVIPPDLLKHLTSLEHFSLSTYKEEIPVDIFKNSQKLKTLYLRVRHPLLRMKNARQRRSPYNATKKVRESVLHPDLFHELKKLERLDLDTKETNWPSRLFQPLKNLVHLRMINNQKVYHGNMFATMKKLQKLSIRNGARGVVFESGFLDHQSHLRLFDLTAKGTNFLPSEFFRSSELMTVFIHAKLVNIPVDLFRLAPSLKFLDMSSERLQFVPRDLFKYNSELISVNFQDNKLKRLPDGLFSNHPELRHVNFQDNQLEMVPHKVFSGLPNLEFLSIHNNNLHINCDLGLTSHPSLKKIHLLENSMTCRQPWMDHFLKKEQLVMEEMRKCFVPRIVNRPSMAYSLEPFTLEFQGPLDFRYHKAYWVSSNVDRCSPFEDVEKMPPGTIQGIPVKLNSRGRGTFLIEKTGEYFLVYKYGVLQPFLPMFEIEIEVF